MSDELDARVRALEAERLRPVPPPPKSRPRINLIDLAEMCEAIAEDDGEEGEIEQAAVPGEVGPRGVPYSADH